MFSSPTSHFFCCGILFVTRFYHFTCGVWPLWLGMGMGKGVRVYGCMGVYLCEAVLASDYHICICRRLLLLLRDRPAHQEG